MTLLAFLLIAELFYRTPLACLAGVPFIPAVRRAYARRRSEQRRRALRDGFRDYLYAVSSAAAAGKSLPAALADADRSVSQLYREGSPVRAFSSGIARALADGGISASEALVGAATPCGVAEIRTFAEICRVTVETGGDLALALGRAEALLSARMETERKIESGFAEKKLELGILVAMPLLILAFLQFSSADYMAILYEGAAGRLVMTAALAAMIGAVVWTRRMMRTDFS